MVKASASSSNIIQSKFKPWRRGKSIKGKHTGKTNTSSVKQQLRGLLRLKDKNQGQPLSEENEARIVLLQQQMATRQSSEKERTNATKSHKLRFLERQKSMRRYKKLVSSLKKNDGDAETIEIELYKLALDQIYIAHYPLGDASYLALYSNHASSGEENKDHRRSILNARLLFKMAAMRHRALEKSRTEERVAWVPIEQYERVQTAAVPEKWTTELERTTFGIQQSTSDTTKKRKEEDDAKTAAAAATDNRFQVSDQHAELLDEAEQIEKDLEEASASDSSDSDASSVDDGKSHQSVIAETKSHASDDEEDASALSHEANDKAGAASNSSDDSDASSSDSDDSSSASSSDDDDNEKEDSSKAVNEELTATTLLVADGFLTTTIVPMATVFDNNSTANKKRPEDAKGDKSQGWATQRQLPGEFRKRRKRQN